MTAIKTRFSMLVVLLSLVAVFPIAARGAIVTGSVSTADGSVIGRGGWATGVGLDWSVADTGSDYLYSYTFEAPDPGLSHLIIQVSENFTERNVHEISSESHEIGTFSTVTSDAELPSEETIFGIKFDDIAGEGPWTLTLLTDRAPMEGDFYAKGGNESFAYNEGFGVRTGANILVPDTESRPVPEPGTMLLVGTGLLGIAGLGRKRFRK